MHAEEATRSALALDQSGSELDDHARVARDVHGSSPPSRPHSHKNRSLGPARTPWRQPAPWPDGDRHGALAARRTPTGAHPTRSPTTASTGCSVSTRSSHQGPAKKTRSISSMPSSGQVVGHRCQVVVGELGVVAGAPRSRAPSGAPRTSIVGSSAQNVVVGSVGSCRRELLEQLVLGLAQEVERLSPVELGRRPGPGPSVVGHHPHLVLVDARRVRDDVGDGPARAARDLRVEPALGHGRAAARCRRRSARSSARG